ncbi:molybdenum ABC transporter ATP-binding protein [Acidocella sp. KAb 2-4]|uniref:molybdenum ABC transporter ATP-binding protein n=1 Tax=Acidocella sp. KAb 2-4 TaxID=2885158 RepID=UPI0021030CEC|nr:molybdenum ABC transporter ATP-binding protein [Acidocella sp. KAb 2-4]
MIAARFAGDAGGFALDVAFEAPSAGITGLFGPSGCGKTTLLRCLAGLLRLPGAALRVDGEIWQEGPIFLPPHRRALGMVFQEARLFAHLSVRENLRFGLRRAKGAPRITDAAVIDALGLEPLLARAPAGLSGGERQRVAIGRALLAQPRLLLLDEPLAALDREAAQQILPRLREVSRLFAVPAVYVSHDLAEIEQIADYLLLMRPGGRIAARGELGALLTDPALPFAARRDAAMVLELRAQAYDEIYDLTTCAGAGVALTVPGWHGPAGAAVRLRVRASDVSIAKTEPWDSSILNALPARILSAETAAGPHVNLVLAVGQTRLLSSITRKSFDSLGLAVGGMVYAQVKAMALAAPG